MRACPSRALWGTSPQRVPRIPTVHPRARHTDPARITSASRVAHPHPTGTTECLREAVPGSLPQRQHRYDNDKILSLKRFFPEGEARVVDNPPITPRGVHVRLVSQKDHLAGRLAARPHGHATRACPGLYFPGATFIFLASRLSMSRLLPMK